MEKQLDKYLTTRSFQVRTTFFSLRNSTIVRASANGLDPTENLAENFTGVTGSKIFG